MSNQALSQHGEANYYERYSYQIAIASTSGFTIQAQNFAATHRIPLIDFDKNMLEGTEKWYTKNNRKMEKSVIKRIKKYDITKYIIKRTKNKGEK